MEHFYIQPLEKITKKKLRDSACHFFKSSSKKGFKISKEAHSQPSALSL